MKDSLQTRQLRLTLPIGFASPLPTGAAKQAVETLGRRIANDVFRPGETMPTEAELAEDLSVSRATVRDAVKVLSGKGMVRTARRYGTRVRPVEEWNLLDPDVASWHEASNPRILQMFAETSELRYIIEPAAAEMAAERATGPQVAALLEAAAALRTDDVQAQFTADCLFHSTLLDATGNSMMRQMRPIILTVLRISYEVGVLAVLGAEVNLDGHLRVAKAVRDRDGSRAQAEMVRMLARNRRLAGEYSAAPPV